MTRPEVRQCTVLLLLLKLPFRVPTKLLLPSNLLGVRTGALWKLTTPINISVFHGQFVLWTMLLVSFTTVLFHANQVVKV